MQIWRNNANHDLNAKTYDSVSCWQTLKIIGTEQMCWIALHCTGVLNKVDIIILYLIFFNWGSNILL